MTDLYDDSGVPEEPFPLEKTLVLTALLMEMAEHTSPYQPMWNTIYSNLIGLTTEVIRLRHKVGEPTTVDDAEVERIAKGFAAKVREGLAVVEALKTPPTGAAS